MNSRIACSLIAFAMLHATPAGAQSHASRSGSVVQTELIKIENEIARANRECDYVYFRRIEATEFIFTDANGTVTTRAEDLAGEKDCKKNSSLQTLDEVVVQLHDDVAILSARSSVPGSRGGQAVIRRSRFTDVFVWRDARWQLVVGHSSRIP